MKIDELIKGQSKKDVAWLMALKAIVDGDKVKEGRNGILFTMAIVATSTFWLIAVIAVSKLVIPF